MKNAISDDFSDDLVVLCFHALPAMDSTELTAFINTILRLAEREVTRAVGDARVTVLRAPFSRN